MIQIEIDIAYDEPTLEEAIERIERFGDLTVKEVAVPGEVMAAHGAWPIISITGDFGTITKWLSEFYDNGDGGEALLAIMRSAKYVDDDAAEEEDLTVTIDYVKQVKAGVRPAGPQDPGEYWWEVYDVETDESIDSVYTEKPGDVHGALEAAVANARDHLKDDARHSWM